MENLPKLMELIPIEEWETNLKDYRLIVHCHSVFDFGNSQKSRKRLLLIGIHKDLDNKVYKNSQISIQFVKRMIHIIIF
jgi:hypothetical protein